MDAPSGHRGSARNPRLLVPLAACATLACCASPPTSEDWLAVGFESPAQTLRTFQTGLKGNEPDLEYDSFSDRFRREQGLSEIVYRELRDELFGRYPFLRRFVRLEIVREAVVDARTRTMTVRLSAFFSERWVEVRFVRDDYYSVRAGSDVLADDYASLGRMLSANNDQLVVVLPTELPIDPREVTRVEVGQEWKIDGFETLDEEQVAALSPTPSP